MNFFLPLHLPSSTHPVIAFARAISSSICMMIIPHQSAEPILTKQHFSNVERCAPALPFGFPYIHKTLFFHTFEQNMNPFSNGSTWADTGSDHEWSDETEYLDEGSISIPDKDIPIPDIEVNPTETKEKSAKFFKTRKVPILTEGDTPGKVPAELMEPCGDREESSESGGSIGWYRRAGVEMPWCYQFWEPQNVGLSWADALWHCRSDASELLWLDDEEELGWLFDVLRSTYASRERTQIHIQKTRASEGHGEIPQEVGAECAEIF